MTGISVTASIVAIGFLAGPAAVADGLHIAFASRFLEPTRSNSKEEFRKLVAADPSTSLKPQLSLVGR
jgi:hypothetical protein